MEKIESSRHAAVKTQLHPALNILSMYEDAYPDGFWIHTLNGYGMPKKERKQPSAQFMKVFQTFLNKCYKQRDLDQLISYRYGLQRGMAALSKKKLNTDEIDIFFATILKSIEQYMKALWRKRNPMPHHNPQLVKSGEWCTAKWKTAKKAQDYQFELFLKKVGY